MISDFMSLMYSLFTNSGDGGFGTIMFISFVCLAISFLFMLYKFIKHLNVFN